MFVMVSYDISNDSRRRTVQRVLEGYGERVQYSVFECHLEDVQLERLIGEIKRVVDSSCDQVRWYALCRWCAGKMEQDGSGQITEDPPYIVV